MTRKGRPLPASAEPFWPVPAEGTAVIPYCVGGGEWRFRPAYARTLRPLRGPLPLAGAVPARED
jgi:hypothetical protein